MKNLFLSNKEKSKQTSFTQDQRGLTFIELIAVLGVIGIISSVAVFNYQRFSDRTELSNDAYEIVMAVREARVRALGVREYPTMLPEDRFQSGYGLYFSSSSGDESSFVHFIDLDGDFEFSENSTVDCLSDECIKTVSLSKRNRLVEICKLIGDGTIEFCNPQISSVSLVFNRPETDAVITFNHPAGGPNYHGAVVKLRSPQGIEISVIIRETGVSSIR